jgi:hypothetical protein
MKLKKAQIRCEGKARTNAHLVLIKVAFYRSDFEGDGTIAFLAEGVSTMVLRIFLDAYNMQ